jgi:CarD family transcriptional regulator
MMYGSDGASASWFDTEWSRRYRINAVKLSSGDPVRISEVIRELSGLEAGRGLCAAEKRMLATARRLLA